MYKRYVLKNNFHFSKVCIIVRTFTAVTQKLNSSQQNNHSCQLGFPMPSRVLRWYFERMWHFILVFRSCFVYQLKLQELFNVYAYFLQTQEFLELEVSEPEHLRSRIILSSIVWLMHWHIYNQESTCLLLI
jgi:hypothetical protein